ncbi:MAG: uncharacterized protein A8A55_2609 [Amphiamblys sp. WSBS2006]|nr:MAG: uncharacterized protein A8A55_2609 [Amphiamblys sp. WSBS2006]
MDVDDEAECRKTLECTTPSCRNEGGRFGIDEYMKAIGEKEEVSALAAQLQAPDTFSLTHDLPNEAVLLTDQTTVTLSNIEISVKLFFVLLEKTRVTAGERFSITKHARNEDCIREHSMARNRPLWLERYEAVSSLALENIERMHPDSIGCVLERVAIHNAGLINILPKLGIHEDYEVEWVWLDANKKEHVGGMLKQGQTFFVGRVKRR